MALQLQQVLAPGPTDAPDCILCGQSTNLFTTRSSNRKGNASRSYYKCVPCGKFHCFADRRGNDLTNPPCHCGESSKRQIAGPEKSRGRQVHYVCRLGKCDYYGEHRTPQQETIVLESELVEPMTRLGLI